MAVMLNEEILEHMAKYAEERRIGNEQIPGGAFRLHGEWDGYVRVSGKGFRSVSVHPDAPLCRFRDGPTRTLAKATSQAAGKPEQFAEGLSKDERCLQAY